MSDQCSDSHEENADLMEMMKRSGMQPGDDFDEDDGIYIFNNYLQIDYLQINDFHFLDTDEDDDDGDDDDDDEEDDDEEEDDDDDDEEDGKYLRFLIIV